MEERLLRLSCLQPKVSLDELVWGISAAALTSFLLWGGGSIMRLENSVCHPPLPPLFTGDAVSPSSQKVKPRQPNPQMAQFIIVYI